MIWYIEAMMSSICQKGNVSDGNLVGSEVPEHRKISFRILEVQGFDSECQNYWNHSEPLEATLPKLNSGWIYLFTYHSFHVPFSLIISLT